MGLGDFKSCLMFRFSAIRTERNTANRSNEPKRKMRFASVGSNCTEPIVNKATLTAANEKATLDIVLVAAVATNLVNSTRSPSMNKMGNEISNIMKPRLAMGRLKAERLAATKSATTESIMKSNGSLDSVFLLKNLKLTRKERHPATSKMAPTYLTVWVPSM